MKYIFKNWITEYGNPIAVTPLEFIDYVRKNGYIKKIVDKNIIYVGERWLCKVFETEEIEEFVIKAIYEEELYSDKISWSYKPVEESPTDYYTDPINDTWEVCEAARKSSGYTPRGENQDLIRLEQKEKEIIKEYKTFINYLKSLDRNIKRNNRFIELLELKIQFMTNPTLHIANKWKKISHDEKIYVATHFNEWINMFEGTAL